MNGKDLMTGMSFVDEKFIQEAEAKQIKKSRPFFVSKYIGIAACFVLLIGTTIGIFSLKDTVPTTSLKETAPTVTQPPGSTEMVPETSDTFLLDMDLIHYNAIHSSRIGAGRHTIKRVDDFLHGPGGGIVVGPSFHGLNWERYTPRCLNPSLGHNRILEAGHSLDQEAGGDDCSGGSAEGHIASRLLCGEEG